MKRLSAILCSVGLVAALAAFPVAAAPPDRDGDGHPRTEDCNDKDPTVWQLNSCGECAVEPVGGCSTTCTDNDGDGAFVEGGSCGPSDCDDANPDVQQLNSCGDCAVEPPQGCGTTSSRDVIVVANNDLGMHCACPGAQYFMLLPPFNTLRAQVIQRNYPGSNSPVVLDDPNDIRVEYNIVENTEDSLRADPYYSTWMQMMPKYGFGPAVNADGKIQGLTGATLAGEMEAKTGEGWWEVVGVPAFPDLADAGEDPTQPPYIMTDATGGGENRNPYLTGNVKVYDQADGALLAETNTTVPVAFGGCCGCHLQVSVDNGGEATPLSSFETMGALHERDSGINIAQIDPDDDGQPGPVRCSVCHLDPAMGESVAPGYTAGDPKFPGITETLPTSQYTFSDVLHRWHVENSTVIADYDPDLATDCYACHPGNGVNCYCGHHSEVMGGSGQNGEIWCSDCHGDLHQRVAEGQLEAPWSDTTLPACEDCHRRTGEGGGYLHLGVFGQYLNSRGHKNDKILCTTCHGAPHALYPSTLAKDNEQIWNVQTGGLDGPIGVCDTCHTGKSSNYGKPNH